MNRPDIETEHRELLERALAQPGVADALALFEATERVESCVASLGEAVTTSSSANPFPLG
jgi:hypothetical protein